MPPRREGGALEPPILRVGPHAALVHAVGLWPPPPAWDPQEQEPWLVAALLAIASRETASHIRQHLKWEEERPASMAIELDGGERLPVTWSFHLRLHPLLLSRPLAGAVHLLLVPACSLLDREHDCHSSQRLAMGRSREELLHNAFLHLMALSRFPLHPSWEGPIMAHLAAAAERGEDCGLTFLRSHGLLQFACLDSSKAEREVEKLWREGRLPVPPAPA